MNEAEPLDTVPSYLCITQMLKATPREEGGERFVYLEASNEVSDLQGEVVLAQALAESADYYLRYGNLDLDHYTQIGPKAGIADYHLFEIGRPVDVRADGRATFVKVQIYQGEGPVADRANHFWDSLTKVNPPQRWYPSVGGAVLEKATDIDPKSHAKRSIIRKVRWTNIGFSKTPVNAAVPTVSTVPFGVLAKCWGPAGLDLSKALEAGYGTDMSQLAGGAALRKQSLDRKVQATLPASYWDFREQIAGALRSRRITNPTAARMSAFAVNEYGLSEDEAAEWVERFMRDLKDNLKRSRQ